MAVGFYDCDQSHQQLSHAGILSLGRDTEMGMIGIKPMRQETCRAGRRDRQGIMLDHALVLGPCLRLDQSAFMQMRQTK